MVPPAGMSTSSAALRTASASKPPYLSLATGSTLLRSTQVWLKPIEQRGGRIALAHHDMEALVLAEAFARFGNADAIRPVLVDDRDLDVLRLHAEPRLGVLGDERGERLAVLVGMDLPAEDVLQVLVLED